MLANIPGHFLHRFDLRAHGPRGPAIQELARPCWRHIFPQAVEVRAIALWLIINIQ